jgi:hypothetical protein
MIRLNLAHVRRGEDAFVADFYFEGEALVLLDVDVIELGRDEEGKDVGLAAIGEDGDETALCGRPSELAVDGAGEFVDVAAEAVGVAEVGGDVDGSEGAIGIAE